MRRERVLHDRERDAGPPLCPWVQRDGSHESTRAGLGPTVLARSPGNTSAGMRVSDASPLLHRARRPPSALGWNPACRTTRARAHERCGVTRPAPALGADGGAPAAARCLVAPRGGGAPAAATADDDVAMMRAPARGGRCGLPKGPKSPQKRPRRGPTGPKSALPGTLGGSSHRPPPQAAWPARAPNRAPLGPPPEGGGRGRWGGRFRAAWERFGR
eukprot:scaffold452_cov491-Prasinococcus_capsulatus_cf.AAC.3